MAQCCLSEFKLGTIAGFFVWVRGLAIVHSDIILFRVCYVGYFEYTAHDKNSNNILSDCMGSVTTVAKIQTKAITVKH